MPDWLETGLILAVRKMKDGMQDRLPWEALRARRRPMALRRISLGKVAVACLALAGGACSSIATPLPDLGPTGSTSMSKEDQKKAVDDLNQKRATHEQDAEKQIEQESR